MAAIAPHCLTGWVELPAHRRDAVLRALPEHIRRTRAEPGCLHFEVVLDPVNRSRLLVSEAYLNQTALAAHRARLARTRWAVLTRGLKRNYREHPCRESTG